MSRVIILLLDSFGIGYTEDAAKFGDVGADTLGHINEWCASNRKDESGKVNYLFLPNMNMLGLGQAAEVSRGKKLSFPLSKNGKNLSGSCGCASPISKGKDTLSGHWEMMGVPVRFDWGYFSDKENSFPDDLLTKLIEEGGIPGILGNKHASGTEIIKELGEEHCRTGKPIVYTSADSVLQIAAHEEVFGLERLYALCQVAFKLVQPYHIARVIARPFVGDNPENYARTGNRHDYAVPAPEETLLDKLCESGGHVHAIGKIADIFAHRGISKHYPATGLEALFDATLKAVHEAKDNSLIFANFVDFDSSYGHRRDVQGYADGLEYIDKRLPELLKCLQPSDLALITADHGCDPTWSGSDHTRENIPALFFGASVRPQVLPPMKTFSDIGQTLAFFLNLSLENGEAQDIFQQRRE
ncbi:MAG: phosphopentomutase [Acidaminococcaceae bacterium]